MTQVEQLAAIFAAIKADPQNQTYTQQQIDPLYSANPAAKILIVGQAPGLKAQTKRRYWDDASGVRLRQWLGVDRTQFYDETNFAILPLDFYYPGKGKSGDLPPRKVFAAKWHPQLLAQLPNIQLTVLVGAYAAKYYLDVPRSAKLTDLVANYQQYLPEKMVVVHPSPRNQIWLRKHPWFEQHNVPELQHRVARILGTTK